MKRKDFARYLDLALVGGAAEPRVIDTGSVVTAEWVRFKCQFGCSGYGHRLCCPPLTPTPERTRRVLDGLSKALIYSYVLPNSGRPARQRRMQRMLAGLEREMFLDGNYKAFAFSAGPCRLCPECRSDAPCRFPEIARPAMEACGIDVFATCRNAGIDLEVVTSRDAPGKYINLILIE